MKQKGSHDYCLEKNIYSALYSVWPASLLPNTMRTVIWGLWLIWCISCSAFHLLLGSFNSHLINLFFFCCCCCVECRNLGLWGAIKLVVASFSKTSNFDGQLPLQLLGGQLMLFVMSWEIWSFGFMPWPLCDWDVYVWLVLCFT